MRSRAEIKSEHSPGHTVERRLLDQDLAKSEQSMHHRSQTSNDLFEHKHTNFLINKSNHYETDDSMKKVRHRSHEFHTFRSYPKKEVSAARKDKPSKTERQKLNSKHLT